MTNQWFKLIIVHVILLFNFDVQAQSIKHELDSLHNIVISDNSQSSNYTVLQQVRHLLEQAKSNHQRDHVADAYLLMVKISFNLNQEAEALRLFKLYIIESNQLNMDSANARTSKRLASYENEVKALLQVQLQLEQANQELIDEKEAFLKKNTFIYYGLLTSIIIGLVIIVLTNRRSKKEKLVPEEKAKLTIDKPKSTKEEETYQIENFKAELHYHDVLSKQLKEDKSKRIQDLKYVKDAFVFDKSKELTGGDGVWFYSTKDKSILIVFDVPGFGASGAMLGSIVKNIFYELVQENKTLAPALILTQLEAGLRQKELANSIPPEGIKVGVCTIDNVLKSADYSGADFSLYVLEQDNLNRLDGDIHPLLTPHGRQGHFKTEKTKIGKKTKLYLSTDGFWNQIGGREKLKFKQSTFEKALITMANQPFDEQEFIIGKLFNNWKGSGEQTDDVLVLGLEF